MSQVEIPPFYRIRQSFTRPQVKDLTAAATQELESLFPDGAIAAGARIGITVGSRGIAGVATLTRAAVEFFKSRGAAPFIVPAMGSHGGARAEAQEQLIAHYGVTEETMGCPVESDMETIVLGKSELGVDCHLAKTAYEADGILLLNRIKPHTDYKGKIESGLTKICAIGLGKYNGAREIHRHLFTAGLGEGIRSVTEKIMATGKIIGGLAVLENAHHETAKIAGVPVDGFFEREAELLDESRGLMGRLPLDEMEVLILDRLGKNISGAGMDTNIIGRSVYGHVQGVPWCEGMPSIMRIVCCEVSEESDGNGVGMGHVDFAPQRFIDQVDVSISALNAMTACAPAGAKTPIILPNDREAIAAGIRTSKIREEGPRIVYVRDTLELEHAYVSEACLPFFENAKHIEVISGPEPLPFNESDELVSPFVAVDA